MIEKFRGPEYIMHRYEQNPIITVEDFPVPARAVFNCGQTMYNGQTILLIAAIYQDRKPNGSITGIHVARSDDGIHFEIEKEPLCDKRDWAGECPGIYDGWVIDPRVTKIDDTYYIVRPAQVSKVGPAAVLEKTKDFKSVEFVECIALPSNRVPCLFPEKINGQYVRLDRPYNVVSLEDKGGDSLDDNTAGGIWISYSPIKTKDGWLEIIHGVYKENREFCYSIGAMLLDLNDPSKIIGITKDCILTPNEPYEIKGRVDNVVFPCGAIADEETDTIRIYYGGADTCIALASGSLSELIDACKKGMQSI